MARPWRVQFEGAVYHVVSRGNGGQNIFLNDTDRGDFLEIMALASERFNLEIFAFSLMSNHYHLLLRTPDANLSSAMHWLNTTYAVRFKVRHRRSGHLFQGRFKSVLVEAEPHWMHLSFYIHLNPVRAGLAENPSQYKWSSCVDYFRSKPRFVWLCRDEILVGLGRNNKERRRSYRRQCMELAKKKPEFWRDVRDAVIIGSEGFKERVRKKFVPSGRKEDVTEYRKMARAGVYPDDELERLALALGIETSKFRSRADNIPARLLAYHHLVQRCGMKQTEVAEYFRISPYAVSKGIKRLKDMAKRKRKLKKIMEMSNVQV